MTTGVKKSQFLAHGDNPLPSAGTIDFVSGGTNFKMTFSNFFKHLGVTGSIVQEGDAGNTPVLDDQGTIKAIRNLKEGFGIGIDLTPDNDIELSTAFTFDETGVTIVDDVASPTPVFRSLVAGAGINVSGSAGQIQIALSGIPVSTKTVIVNQLSDFPAAIGGIINLADDTEYAVRNDITINGDRFVLGNNTVLSGSDVTVTNLTYTGSSNMFTSVNKTWGIKNLKCTCTSGTFMNVSGTGVEILRIVESAIICDVAGSISDMLALRIDSVQLAAVTNGFSFSGSNSILFILGMLNQVQAGTVFDLGTSTFDSINLTLCQNVLSAGVIFLSGLAGSGNINTGGLGSLIENQFLSLGTPLNNISPDDELWQFTSNSVIADTRTSGMLSMQGNTTQTVIAVAGTPVLVAGAWFVVNTSRMTGTVAGRLTYDPPKPGKFPITSSVSVEPVSGVNISISAFIAVNGVVQPGSERTANASSGQPTSITIPWLIDFTEDDFVELFVANDDTTSNVIVSSAIHRVN